MKFFKNYDYCTYKRDSLKGQQSVHKGTKMNSPWLYLYIEPSHDTLHKSSKIAIFGLLGRGHGRGWGQMFLKMLYKCYTEPYLSIDTSFYMSRQSFLFIRFCLGLTTLRAWPGVWLRSDVFKNGVEMFYWTLPFHRYLILYVSTKFCSYTILPWEHIRAHPEFKNRPNIF